MRKSWLVSYCLKYALPLLSNLYVFTRSWYSLKLIILSLGGKVTVPMDDSENKLLTRLAEEYYITCDAEAQSGKTVWVGIVPDIKIKGRWVVS